MQKNKGILKLFFLTFSILTAFNYGFFSKDGYSAVKLSQLVAASPLANWAGFKQDQAYHSNDADALVKIDDQEYEISHLRVVSKGSGNKILLNSKNFKQLIERLQLNEESTDHQPFKSFPEKKFVLFNIKLTKEDLKKSTDKVIQTILESDGPDKNSGKLEVANADPVVLQILISLKVRT